VDGREAVGALLLLAFRSDLAGAALYRQLCASCHEQSAVTRAPGNVLLAFQ
jgi:hypothetical protein